jgi:hypothetical protein
VLGLALFNHRTPVAAINAHFVANMEVSSCSTLLIALHQTWTLT